MPSASGSPPTRRCCVEHFPDPRYVHVTRRDKIAQAVSLWRAVQTRAWRAGEVTENGNAVYHAGAIGYLAGQLSDHDDAWRTWFSANRIEPLRIVYEELAADTTGVTSEVLDHLGVGPAEIPDPPLRRQGDDRSERWARALPGRMSVSELDRLEAESIHIMREVAAELERPVLLFSGGKDSLVLLQLADQGVPARRVPVPGPPRRHRPQLPRGARVPRPPDRARSASS